MRTNEMMPGPVAVPPSDVVWADDACLVTVDPARLLVLRSAGKDDPDRRRDHDGGKDD